MLALVILVAIYPLVSQEIKSRVAFSQIPHENGFLLKIGEKTFGPYKDFAFQPFLSLDGKNHLFVLRNPKNEIWVIANNKEYGPFKGDWIDYTQISENGANWFIHTTIKSKSDYSEKSFLIINGKEYEGESIKLIKQADGLYFVWLVYNENGQVNLNYLKVE